MNLNLDFLAELCGSRDVAEKFANPTKSKHQKKMEANGWEFVDNHCFKSILDYLGEYKQIWGEPINLEKGNLSERMVKSREHYMKIHSAKKVRFAKAYDIQGYPVPEEEMIKGVYVKRRLN